VIVAKVFTTTSGTMKLSRVHTPRKTYAQITTTGLPNFTADELDEISMELKVFAVDMNGADKE